MQLSKNIEVKFKIFRTFCASFLTFCAVLVLPTAINANELSIASSNSNIESKIIELKKTYSEQYDSGDKMEAMKTAFIIGHYYIDFLMDFNNGVDYVRVAYSLAQELNNIEYQIKTLQQMAFIHYSWGETNNAIIHYQEALEIAERENDIKSIINVNIYLADILMEEYRTKEAIIHFKKVLALKDKEELSPQALYALGSYYKLIEKTDSTLYYYQVALNQFEENLNVRWESYINSQLATTYLLNGDTKSAFDYANKGLAIAKENNCKKEIYDNYLSLSEIYKVGGDFENSLKYYRLYAELKDSIYKAKINQNVEYLQLMIKLEAEEKENTKLTTEKKINETELLNKKYAFYIVISGLLILLAIIVIFYFRLMVIKKQKIEIEKSYKNEVKLVDEKQTLLKEVHHRVKNNMQIMTSLLSLQQHSLTDEKVIDLFEQSKFRIRAMAMIHEMLYQSDDIGLIEYEVYLNELGRSLIDSFNLENRNIKLNINAPKIYLNIDTAVPLGLIINEIVTNSLKYGFTEQEEGSIYINIENIGNHKYILKIGDNGCGFDYKKEYEKESSLGLNLIDSLTSQLNGKLEMTSSKGANFLISFEELNYN